MINAAKITANELLAGKYKNELPELYSLRSCFENNSWHNNESVFNHTIKVFENMTKTLRNAKTARAIIRKPMGFLIEKTASFSQSWLDEKIGKMPRKELLLISSLLHDIAKGESLVRNDDETTSCPKHEELAGERIKQFSGVFGMDNKSVGLVKKIVSHHGEMHKALEYRLNGNNSEIEALKKSGVYFELLLLCYADTLNSYLAVTNPGEYEKRIEFYGNEILFNFG